jgi:hypothetical protein
MALLYAGPDGDLIELGQRSEIALDWFANRS